MAGFQLSTEDLYVAVDMAWIDSHAVPVVVKRVSNAVIPLQVAKTDAIETPGAELV
jgi:hypothetical protein